MADAVEATERPARRIPVWAVVIAALAVVGLIVWLVLRPDGRANLFTGYVTSNNIYMSSPVAGTMMDVSVQRGQRIKTGDPLFRVDPTVREARTDQARAQIAANEAAVEQQQSALGRAQADLAAAQADADRYGAELRRLSAAQHEKPGSVAQLDIDQAQASYQGALRRRDSSRTQLASASAAIAAARAQVRESQAGLTSATRELSELAPVAPRAGRVEDVMFKPGESVTANVPVISIVPDGEVKVRFYIPQGQVSDFKPGRRVAVGCDGCVQGLTAVVDFVASEPEFTPPVIYSLDARQKLVFLVEAVPSNPRALIPGQPLDVGSTAGDLPAR